MVTLAVAVALAIGVDVALAAFEGYALRAEVARTRIRFGSVNSRI